MSLKPKPDDWFDIAGEAWLLWAESCVVVGLRASRLARGGSESCAEARLMVTEKIESTAKLGTALAQGRMGSRPAAIAAGTLSHYRALVGANRKRLSRRR